MRATVAPASQVLPHYLAERTGALSCVAGERRTQPDESPSLAFFCLRAAAIGGLLCSGGLGLLCSGGLRAEAPLLYTILGQEKRQVPLPLKTFVCVQLPHITSLWGAAQKQDMSV